ncbi:MAG TPA: hypothetical protein VMV87_03260, partial [Burkholderiales bacterium]|nr:hypothetical protein [Burkholderiales bacterium]
MHRNNLTFYMSRRQWQLIARDLFGSQIRDEPTADEPRHGSSDGMCFSRSLSGEDRNQKLAALQSDRFVSRMEAIGLGRSSST